MSLRLPVVLLSFLATLASAQTRAQDGVYMKAGETVFTMGVVTRRFFRLDHAGFFDRYSRHLFLIPAAGGAPVQLTDGRYQDGAPVWTADEKELLFASYRGPRQDQTMKSEIYADHRRRRPSHAEWAERGVLPGAPDQGRSQGDGPPSERAPRLFSLPV